jgi:hypothetical protein
MFRHAGTSRDALTGSPNGKLAYELGSNRQRLLQQAIIGAIGRDFVVGCIEGQQAAG